MIEMHQRMDYGGVHTRQERRVIGRQPVQPFREGET